MHFVQAVASKIDLQDQFVYYFGLYLVGKESEDDFSSNSCFSPVVI